MSLWKSKPIKLISGQPDPEYLKDAICFLSDFVHKGDRALPDPPPGSTMKFLLGSFGGKAVNRLIFERQTTTRLVAPGQREESSKFLMSLLKATTKSQLERKGYVSALKCVDDCILRQQTRFDERATQYDIGTAAAVENIMSSAERYLNRVRKFLPDEQCKSSSSSSPLESLLPAKQICSEDEGRPVSESVRSLIDFLNRCEGRAQKRLGETPAKFAAFALLKLAGPVAGLAAGLASMAVTSAVNGVKIRKEDIEKAMSSLQYLAGNRSVSATTAAVALASLPTASSLLNMQKNLLSSSSESLPDSVSVALHAEIAEHESTIKQIRVYLKSVVTEHNRLNANIARVNANVACVEAYFDFLVTMQESANTERVSLRDYKVVSDVTREMLGIPEDLDISTSAMAAIKAAFLEEQKVNMREAPSRIQDISERIHVIEDHIKNAIEVKNNCRLEPPETNFKAWVKEDKAALKTRLDELGA